MKLNSVLKKLGVFKSVSTDKNVLYFYSRSTYAKNKYVKVIISGDDCNALPIVHEGLDERVSFHATTIKSLVEFLKGEPC